MSQSNATLTRVAGQPKENFIMDEKAEIIFMQTRLVRLASEEWHLSVEKRVELFKKVDAFWVYRKRLWDFPL